MERDALFQLLLQQGLRLFDTDDDRQRSLFEWRTELIMISHPTGDVYSPIELMWIDALLARQTDGEVSVATPVSASSSSHADDGEAGDVAGD